MNKYFEHIDLLTLFSELENTNFLKDMHPGRTNASNMDIKLRKMLPESCPLQFLFVNKDFPNCNVEKYGLVYSRLIIGHNHLLTLILSIYVYFFISIMIIFFFS